MRDRDVARHWRTGQSAGSPPLMAPEAALA